MKRRILCFVLTMAMVLSMLVVVPAVTVSADTVLNIGTASALRELATAVNAGTYDSGVTVNITANIDISDAEWTSIGTSTYPFRGTFNGNGHTISGLYQNKGGAVGGNVGLFGNVSAVAGGTTNITNFKLTGKNGLTWQIECGNGGSDGGTVAATVRGVAGSNITVNFTGIWSSVSFDASNSLMTGAGGILGSIAWVSATDTKTTVNIDSCWYSGNMASPGAGVKDYGGIFGWTRELPSSREINITNCLVTGTLKFSSGTTYDDNGGIAGFIKGTGYSNNARVTGCIKDTIFAGTLWSPNKSGTTVAGYIISEISTNDGVDPKFQIANCYYVPSYTGGQPAGWFGYPSNTARLTSSNVTSKTLDEVKAMTASNVTMTDTSKWYFGESTELPVPAMIYDNIITQAEPAEPSIFDDMTQSEFTITSDDEMEEFRTLVNNGTTFAGKTIKLGANVALNGRIGATSSLAFSGSFDGQGHTVTITQSISNPDGNGGLFDFVRIPAGSTIYIKDVHVTGTITLTNNTGGKGYCGGLISSVDGNTSGAGGTINITNVWNTVRINGGQANAWNSIGGFIGFVRHADGLKPITINIDSCLWDGVINCGPAMYHVGGFISYTGNNKAGRQAAINITNSVAAGRFMSNINEYNQQFGVLTSYLKGSFSDEATAKLTVNISDVISVTTATFSKPTGSGSKIGLIEEVDGTTELNLTNLYYKTFTRTGVEGDFPVVASGSATTSTNVVEKTQAQLLALSTSAFTDSSKWVKQSDEYYPCPAGIVSTFGSVPTTLYVEQTDINIGTAEALNALATAVNGGKTYEGKTIHITADITIESGWTSIGITSSKPFMGNFNGHGHTIEIHQTLSNPDGIGGLIGFSRTPASGTVTIENLHLTGRIDATNTTTGMGYFGGVAACVDANTSGTGGTINFNNVWNSVYINSGNANAWWAIGGYIGFVRHADGLAALTINFDSCVWDGTLNTGPAAYYFGGYVGYTGNNKAGRTLTINISNSVAAGTIALNIDWNQTAGLLVGYAKGNYSDAETAKVTINVENVVSNGKMTFKTGTPGSESNIGHIGSIDGTTELNMTNFYYNAFTRGVMEGKAPALGNGTATTETNVEAKTAVGFSALTTAQFTDASKWNKTTGYIVCPAGIVSTFGEISSKLVSNDSGVYTIGTAAALIEFRNEVNAGTTYAGETVKLTADIDLSGIEWVSIGVPGNTSGSTCKPFQGTFDGQGHTISNMTTFLEPTSGFVDMQGGLFSSLGDGAVVKNFTLTGTYTVHNISTATGTTDYFGSVANAVKGTVLIQNVKSSVNITTSVSKNSNNAWPGAVERVAGIVGFIYHHCSANLTIDGCEYSGTINTGNQAIDYAGIMAHTGNNNNSSTKVVTIQNCAFTGRMTLNENYAYAMQGVAGIISHVSGGATVNIANTYSAGKIYFNSKNNWPVVDGDGNPIKMGQILGYNEDGTTVNIASTVTYAPAKLNRTSGDDSTRYILPEAGRLNGVYAADTPAGLENMEIYAEARNESSYKGIRFVATISSASCTGAGTSAANFGIYIITKDMYDLFRNAITVEKLDAAKAVTTKVTKVNATKYKSTNDGLVVCAVVYGFDTASDMSGELVAIPYVGTKLGDAVITTYNDVFN